MVLKISDINYLFNYDKSFYLGCLLYSSIYWYMISIVEQLARFNFDILWEKQWIASCSYVVQISTAWYFFINFWKELVREVKVPGRQVYICYSYAHSTWFQDSNIFGRDHVWLRNITTECVSMTESKSTCKMIILSFYLYKCLRPKI